MEEPAVEEVQELNVEEIVDNVSPVENKEEDDGTGFPLLEDMSFLESGGVDKDGNPVVDQAALQKQLEESKRSTLLKMEHIEQTITDVPRPSSWTEAHKYADIIIRVMDMKQQYGEGPTGDPSAVIKLMPKDIADRDLKEEYQKVEAKESDLSFRGRELISKLYFIYGKRTYANIVRSAANTAKVNLVKKWWE